MLNISNLLDIKYYDGDSGGYTDLKMKLGSAGRDTSTLTFKDNDYIYLGYEKPVKNIYFDFSTPNSTQNILNFEYFDGTDWVDLVIYDETQDFTRSGMVQWEELSDMNEVEISNITKYWVRIYPSVSHSEAVYNFMGLLLSSDEDLVLENPYILDTNLLMGESSHLKAHVSARDEIVQSCANRGNKKNNNEPISYWDMLDISEFKQGAIFLTLSKIYLNLSDRQDDVWLNKSYEYRNRYKKQLDLYYVTLDKDNTGMTSSSEKSAKSVVKTMQR